MNKKRTILFWKITKVTWLIAFAMYFAKSFVINSIYSINPELMTQDVVLYVEAFIVALKALSLAGASIVFYSLVENTLSENNQLK